MKLSGERMVLWRRLDGPGHEAARLSLSGAEWRLEGTAVFAEEGRPCRLDYRIICDARWNTRRALVEGWMGSAIVSIELSADSGRRWSAGGRERPELAGCHDVDFAFSPATNLLPIRRLALEPGEEAPALAAWLSLPDLRLEPLDQIYRRLGPATYRYGTADGTFVSELEVDSDGFVVRYPGRWEMESTGKPGPNG